MKRCSHFCCALSLKSAKRLFHLSSFSVFRCRTAWLCVPAPSVVRLFQVNPKGARMKGPAMDCFSTFKRFENERLFMVHTWAMVPLYRPAGTSRAFPQRIAGTIVGQEHAPTETSRPLSTGPDPCGRLQSFGAARPWLRLS